jgi:hypothetical protein
MSSRPTSGRDRGTTTDGTTGPQMNRKVVSVGVHAQKDFYNPRYNDITLDSIKFHVNNGDREHDVIRVISPRPNTVADKLTGDAQVSPRPVTAKPVDTTVITGFVVGDPVDRDGKTQVCYISYMLHRCVTICKICTDVVHGSLQARKEEQIKYRNQIVEDEEVNRRLREQAAQEDYIERSLQATGRNIPSAISRRNNTESAIAADSKFIFGSDEAQFKQRAYERDRAALASNIQAAEERKGLRRTPSTQVKIQNQTELSEIRAMQQNGNKEFCIGSSESAEEKRSVSAYTVMDNSSVSILYCCESEKRRWRGKPNSVIS